MSLRTAMRGRGWYRVYFNIDKQDNVKWLSFFFFLITHYSCECRRARGGVASYCRGMLGEVRSPSERSKSLPTKLSHSPCCLFLLLHKRCFLSVLPISSNISSQTVTLVFEIYKHGTVCWKALSASWCSANCRYRLANSGHKKSQQSLTWRA